MSIIAIRNPAAGTIELSMEFDEINFDVEIDYEGAPFDLAARPPSAEEMDSEESVAAMASYLVRQYADRVRIKTRQNRSIVQLHFEH